MNDAAGKCPLHKHAAALSEMVGRSFQRPRPDGSIPRPFHQKAHGCLIGEFHAEPTTAPEYRHGVFAERRIFKVVARFSNSFLPGDGDPDIRGLALKLSGVSGESCAGAEPGRQDFLFVSQAAFPAAEAATAREMLSVLDGVDTTSPASVFAWRYAFPSWNPARFRWRYLKLVLDVARTHFRGADLAGLSYYGNTPYKLGEGAVKYELLPESGLAKGGRGRGKTFRERLQTTLARGPLRFGFYIRPKLGEHESLEDADVPWRTPLIRVGSLVFPSQDFAENDALGEGLAFAPWNCLRAHEPLGSINALRRDIYREAAERRGAKRVNDAD